MMGAGSFSSHLLLSVAWVLLLVFLGIGLACVVALVGMRGWRRALADRRERELAALRGDLIAVVVGEEPEATEAARRLTALRGSRWDRADELLVGMLTKVRGDAKARVLALLLQRGADERALWQLGSRRAFARCRGAHALGALGTADAVEHIVAVLGDRSPLVRRVAVRSLGMLGDASAADALLDAANRDIALHRDFTQALAQLPGEASAALRARLDRATTHRNSADRSGPVAATALGMRGDVAAVRELIAALDRGTVPLQWAAAQALGQLGSPAAVPALQRALTSPSAQVQLAAAAALGRLGEDGAIASLLGAVEQGDPAVSRSAAAALLSLGSDGREALMASTTPYAVEAIAVDALRRSS